MKWCTWLLIAVLVLNIGAEAQAAKAEPLVGIEQFSQELKRSLTAKDTSALARLFGDSAEFVSADGITYAGTRDIRAFFEEFFQAIDKSSIEMEITGGRQINSEVAVLHAMASVRFAQFENVDDEQEPSKDSSRLVFILVKRDNRWSIEFADAALPSEAEDRFALGVNRECGKLLRPKHAFVEYPQDRRYSKTHQWVRIDGEEAVIGITTYQRESLGDLVAFVLLPSVGDRLHAGERYGQIESLCLIYDLEAPLSGRVTAVNRELATDATDVNKDPLKTWIIKIKWTDAKELDSMLTVAAYEQYVHEIEQLQEKQ
jgi:glycine cleavage system H protein